MLRAESTCSFSSDSLWKSSSLFTTHCMQQGWFPWLLKPAFSSPCTILLTLSWAIPIGRQVIKQINKYLRKRSKIIGSNLWLVNPRWACSGCYHNKLNWDFKKLNKTAELYLFAAAQLKIYFKILIWNSHTKTKAGDSASKLNQCSLTFSSAPCGSGHRKMLRGLSYYLFVCLFNL